MQIRRESRLNWNGNGNYAAKDIRFGVEARAMMLKGVEELVDAVKVTMATEDMGEAIEEKLRLQYLLLRSLVPKNDADERECILEIRAGTGGEEASLFAMDIFRMYEKYAHKND
ncbi:hypothetical protein PIB30_079333 [Stylosanthes scabra]|uniref:Peptide chain release factor domain-containing protein n=1 Tax=Stylosanthes scabra TaxID=79078 RepID=A0ABU6WPE1_9FABA|nr:hypothetical protein [Stylosanthes scabra]